MDYVSAVALAKPALLNDHFLIALKINSRPVTLENQMRNSNLAPEQITSPNELGQMN